MERVLIIGCGGAGKSTLARKLGETCACCGKPADKMIYWGIAY